jgi:hypothetical protein
MAKAAPKPTTGVKKIKGLSVIKDRAYAQATYTATYLFTLDYVKRTKQATYHDRWPSNEQVREWKARAARAWKYAAKAQREVWDMKAREHRNQQPLIAERVIQSLQTNASKSYGAVSLDIGEWCSATTIQAWLASFKSYSVYVEQVYNGRSTCRSPSYYNQIGIFPRQNTYGFTTMRSGYMASLTDRSVMNWDSKKKCMPSTIKT